MPRRATEPGAERKEKGRGSSPAFFYARCHARLCKRSEPFKQVSIYFIAG